MLCEHRPTVYVPHLEGNLLEFCGGDRRKEGLVSGTWPIRHQFQLSELSKVVNRHCYSFSLNMRGLSKDAGSMRSASRGYLHSSSAVSQKFDSACAYLKGTLQKLCLHEEEKGVDD